MKIKLLSISILTLLVLGGVLFYSLGGFRPLEIDLVDMGSIRLSGIHYRGTPQDEALRNAFEKIEHLAKDAPEPVLHTIYYVEPAGKLDTMEVFVGLPFSVQAQELTPITLDGNRAIVAKIKSHRFVMPDPNKVKVKIVAFAEEKGLPIPHLFVDRILGPNEVHVIGLTSLE